MYDKSQVQPCNFCYNPVKYFPSLQESRSICFHIRRNHAILASIPADILRVLRDSYYPNSCAGLWREVCQSFRRKCDTEDIWGKFHRRQLWMGTGYAYTDESVMGQWTHFLHSLHAVAVRLDLFAPPHSTAFRDERNWVRCNCSGQQPA